MVGDIIIVKRDEQVPCDIIILYSSDENKSAWVDTANLDGESSLKPKIPLCGSLSEEDFPQYQEQIGSSGFFALLCYTFALFHLSIISKRLWRGRKVLILNSLQSAGIVQRSAPTRDIHDLRGVLEYRDSRTEDSTPKMTRLPIDIQNAALRGSTLRNPLRCDHTTKGLSFASTPG